MTELDKHLTDSQLESIAAASRARAGASDANRPEPTSATMTDVLRAAQKAREAAEASGVPVATDQQERWERLRPVLEQLPPGARKATPDELRGRIHQRILRAVLGWHWGSGNLILMGRTRAGKTSGAAHLVRRLCHEAARHGGEAFELAQLIRWQSCRELSEVARETKLGAGVPEEVRRCQYARLLVLNDLGADDDRKTIERIVDARNEREYPTITTTGMRRGDIERMLGDALASRFYECGADKGTFVEVWPETAQPGGKAR